MPGCCTGLPELRWVPGLREMDKDSGRGCTENVTGAGTMQFPCGVGVIGRKARELQGALKSGG